MDKMGIGKGEALAHRPCNILAVDDDAVGIHKDAARADVFPAAVERRIGEGVFAVCIGREFPVRHGIALAVLAHGIGPLDGNAACGSPQRSARQLVGRSDHAPAARADGDGVLLRADGHGIFAAFKAVAVAFKHKGVLARLAVEERDGGILIGDDVVRALYKDGVAVLNCQLVGIALLRKDAKPGVQPGLPASY